MEASNPTIDHPTREDVDQKPLHVEPTEDTSNDGEKPEYATGLRLFLIMFTLNFSGLLTALEIGIISTAIPAITDDFHSLDDVGWYGSATFMVTAATSALWGKVYKYCNVRYVFLSTIVIFLVGSIVAASAQSSVAVIVGRAVQGFGIIGTMNGSIIVINYVSHPQKHPMLIGIWTSVFMISTILGPIVGGALTSGTSWRWCFWINLPLGGPILALLIVFLKVPKHIKPTPATWSEIILQLDLPGFSLLLASLVCFALALQWGGQTKSWSNGSVVATLVVWILLVLIFLIVEKLQDTRAMVLFRLVKPRTTWANVLWSFVANVALYQVIFYLPIYFQSIHGQSAIISGVNSLPFLAFFAAGAMLGGTLVGKTRYSQPYQLTSAVLMTAGMAILYTLDLNSSKARYIGGEVLFGFGVGLGNQIPIMVVQGLSKPEDVPSSTGIMFMTQTSSAVLFIVIAQSIFANRMLQTIIATAPNLNAAQVIGTGASDIRNAYHGQDLSAVLNAYMTGIKDVFICSLVASGLAVLLALLIPLQKLPDHKSDDDQSEGTEEKALSN
ncbi:MAG: dynein heavy chain [Bogoriella megaspora]|nr:MAG: dynein heavy chain [Bogoriella megaspora]